MKYKYRVVKVEYPDNSLLSYVIQEKPAGLFGRILEWTAIKTAYTEEEALSRVRAYRDIQQAKVVGPKYTVLKD